MASSLAADDLARGRDRVQPISSNWSSPPPSVAGVPRGTTRTGTRRRSLRSRLGGVSPGRTRAGTSPCSLVRWMADDPTPRRELESRGSPRCRASRESPGNEEPSESSESRTRGFRGPTVRTSRVETPVVRRRGARTSARARTPQSPSSSRGANATAFDTASLANRRSLDRHGLVDDRRRGGRVMTPAENRGA